MEKPLLLRHRTAVLSAALLGGLLGLSHGWALGWLLAQAVLTLQMALLFRPGTTPGAATWRAGVFAVAMGLGGYAGFLIEPPAGHAGVMAGAGVVLLLAHGLPAAAGAWLCHRLTASVTLRALLAWPALWCGQELLMAQGSLALPWLRIGQLQAPNGPWAGALPLGGTLLAGLAMWAAAFLLWRAWAHAQTRRRSLSALAVLFGITQLCSNVGWTTASGDVDAVLLQPGAGRSTEQLMASLDAAAHSARSQLLVGPQLMLAKTASALPADYLPRLQRELDHRDSDLLLGLYLANGDDQLHNAVLSLGGSGTQRYLKRQLFPFGEFTPTPGALRALLAGGVPSQDTARGPAVAEPMWLGGHRVSLNLCFELAFPGLWREEAAVSELLINLSADMAHPSMLFGRQVTQMAAARALEFQKPLLHSTDMGGALAMDHRGRIVAQLPRHTSTSLPVTLQAQRGLTPYARLGDKPALLLAAAALLFAALLGRPREPVVHRLRPVLNAQRGQVLMATVALLLISAGLLYYMVNTGQAVTEKMRVTNAADAAAYSAGVLEARALNHDAYLNRAMLANEIAIAQMVSVGSWIRYFANAVDEVPASAGDLITMLQPSWEGAQVTVIFAATKVVLEYYTGQSANYYADYVLQYGIGPIVTIHDAVIMAMELAQDAVHLNLTAGLRQKQIADDVAQAMDPSLQTQVVLASHGFDNFTKSYADDERDRFADVTLRSRDPFSRERNWTINGPDINMPGPLGRKDGALKKRGGTDLIGYDEWRGMDTLELHGRKWNCGKWGISLCDDIRKPVGWSAVQIKASSGGGSGNGHHGNAYGENGTTANKSEGEMEEPGNYSFHGLPAVRELRDVSGGAELSTGITIMVTKNHAAMMTSGGMAQAKPSGDLALFDDKPAGARMAALARAQIFFDRISPRADGKTEIASLYNPYWRVRLVAPTAADRAWAAAQQGGLALP